MTLTDVVATLAREPFNLPLDQIKRLTLFQVCAIYLREIDRKGRLIPLPHPEGVPVDSKRALATWSVINRVPAWFRKVKYES